MIKLSDDWTFTILLCMFGMLSKGVQDTHSLVFCITALPLSLIEFIHDKDLNDKTCPCTEEAPPAGAPAGEWGVGWSVAGPTFPFPPCWNLTSLSLTAMPLRPADLGT